MSRCRCLHRWPRKPPRPGSTAQVAPAKLEQNVAHKYFPAEVEAPPWVAARREAQLKSRDAIGVDTAFQFTDVQAQSGINFLHRFVDDAGIVYKAVHYDHGNGIAVADVDGDGRLDVYLVSQVGTNGLFRNLGGGRFKNITASAGVAVADAIGVSASFADIDNDGDADLYVTNVRSPNRLFLNDGKGVFKDVSAGSGVAISEHSSGAVFFDYDRDGLLDLFLTIVGEYTGEQTSPVRGLPPRLALEGPAPRYHVGYRDAFAGHLKPERERASRLFHNQGAGRFKDVTEAMGLVDKGWSGDATPTDFNGDGWPDLYVLSMQGHDHYWVNREGKGFEEQTETVFKRTPWGAMGVKSFDYDNDGDLDLVLSDMHSDMSEKVGVDREKLKAAWIEKNWAPEFLRSGGRSIYGNALYRNDGAKGFTEVSDAMNVENYWPWGLTAADLNADGWQDLFMTLSMNYPFRYQPNAVLLNDEGKGFRDAEYLVGVEPRRDGLTSKPWLQLACDGMHKSHPDCRERSGTLVIHGALGSRSSAIFDMDDDGDLDIITNEFGDVPQVLRSNLAQERGDKLRYLQVRLEGRGGNRDALGARVTVVADGKRYVQVNDGQSGYLSHSLQPLYFGLGDAETLERIVVRWPDGTEQVYSEELGMNRRLALLQRAE